MDQIFLHNLHAHAILGVHPEERIYPQDILIHLTLFTDLAQAGQTDQLADTVDYEALAARVLRHVESAQRFTVEALAQDLANLCLAEALIAKVIVRVEKPQAISYCKTVGVEITRQQKR